MASASSKSTPALLDVESDQHERGFVSDSIAAGVLFALVLTVGQRVVGFGRGILFCRLMTDQQLGQWSMILSYLMLLAPLAVLGLPGCFGKFTEYYRQRGQLKPFISRVAGISVVLTLLMSGVLFIFSSQFSWLLLGDSSQGKLIQYLALALVVVTASNFIATLMESLRQVRTVTVMRFATGIMFALVGVLFLLTWSDGSSAATLAFAISCGVGMLPGIWVLWKCRGGFENAGDPLTHSMMWKRIAPFAIWMWVSNLFTNLFEVTDRYMLIHWSTGTSDMAQASVGQYHSGRVVPLLLVSVAAMLGGLLMPYLSQAWEAGNKDLVKKQLTWTVKLVAISFTAGGVLVLLLAPLLFDQILQGRYNGGLTVLPMTLVYCIWFGIVCVSQDYLWVAEKGKWATFANAFGLLVNIGFNVVLIPIIGLQGAVLATACGNATLVLLMTLLNHRFGCKADVGIWICLALPMLLLLTKPLAIGAVSVVGLVCVATQLVLSADEKTDLVKFVRSKLSKAR